ncbi:hypothetical protein E3U55_03480 [Filobacillus milosensis]|uniref:Uncharacterized protein n=1 Tax=Filobacillus milosensis TaxID=94137 RepID=A0A4Y8IQN3_9BACI|nr:hypothetical protein [Filobacillus milosensis]TFB23888.1 hypothetical protein E3U55_03480 [Filobacillus milosensis]
MLNLKSLEEFQWIKEETVSLNFDSGEGCRVFNILPNRYSHYCKILHPVYRDKNIKDETILWNECDPNEPFYFNYGERLTFKALAEKYNLNYSKEINSSSIANKLGGYPRYLILGDEGTTDENTLQELFSVLKPLTNQEQCYFQYDVLKIINEFHDFQEFEHGLLYYGNLDDVLSTYHMGDFLGVGSPTYWWAEDKSWCIHTDYDSDFSLVGGNKELIDELLSHNKLECLEVELKTKI